MQSVQLYRLLSTDSDPRKRPTSTKCFARGAVRAEKIEELAADPLLTDPNARTLPTQITREGIGVVEAPRGTLFHHHQTNENGLIDKANLIVATQNNAARTAMSVEKAAKRLISGGHILEGSLNKVEMAFCAYDPCNGCATHALPGTAPLLIHVHDHSGNTVAILRRYVSRNVHYE